MPKTRVQKEAILGTIADRVGRSESIVFISLEKIRVDEVEQLREVFFKDGLQLQVAKNSLLKKVLEDAKLEVPAEILDQPLGLVYSYDDAIAGPKAVTPFLKEIENLKILGGITSGAFITDAQVSALAKLPSREQLLSMLVGTLQAPISGTVNVLAANLRNLVQVLSAVKDAKPAA
ncbi:50S ribosomal protein L10 [soil metagenome]